MEFGNNEVFRAIDGFLNYEVSTHGRVRNNKTGRILKQKLIGKPGKQYYAVDLSIKSDKKTKKIHQLVANAFVANPDNLPVVDHISKNKLDNSLENIRWNTYSGNSRNQLMRSNNTSLVQGLSFLQSSKTWQASIVNDTGKRITKSFSLSKHPNAKELAEAWRREKAAELNYVQAQ